MGKTVLLRLASIEHKALLLPIRKNVERLCPILASMARALEGSRKEPSA
jgi:hypothetical protein